MHVVTSVTMVTVDGVGSSFIFISPVRLYIGH